MYARNSANFLFALHDLVSWNRLRYYQVREDKLRQVAKKADDRRSIWFAVLWLALCDFLVAEKDEKYVLHSMLNN